MPSIVAAERILAVVTTPDHAASTVGDLLEDVPGRGPVWFWSSVFQTACLYVWQDLRTSPRQMVWLGFSGLLKFFVLAAGLGWTVIPLWMLLWPYHPAPNFTYIPPWGLIALQVVTLTAVPFAVGWDIASRSKSRELAAGIASTAVFAAFHLTYAFLSAMQVDRIGRPIPGVDNARASFWGEALFLIIGTILFRVRARRANRAPGSVPKVLRLLMSLSVVVILAAVALALLSRFPDLR